MGASSAEIDQEIRQTRGELEDKLSLLERRAKSGARVYGRVAAGVAIGVLAVAAGAIIYRRRRDRALVKQLHLALFETVRDLPQDVISRLKERLPIQVVVTDKGHDERSPNAWVSLAQKIAPTVVGSVAGAVVARMRGTPPETTTSE
jgi:hypothetical protein